MGIAYSVAKLFDLFSLILIARILLTWFPNINWQNQPFKGLRIVADFYLDPFRRVIPPLGMLDLSPIIAFALLGIMRTLVIHLLRNFGF